MATKNKIQTVYHKALKFAAAKHLAKGQTVPGTDLPYVVHLSNVGMEILIAGLNSKEFDVAFAVQVAMLHDTLEDTDTELSELENKFGIEIAQAVLALTKNEALPKEERMQDCLTRIKKLQKEVWAVKLADRITNLQPPPPDWSKEKRIKYQEEARMILRELGSGNDFLAKELESKINEYESYI